jgi:hypothetical protein
MSRDITMVELRGLEPLISERVVASLTVDTGGHLAVE